MPGPRDDSWARVLDENAPDELVEPSHIGGLGAQLRDVDIGELEKGLKQIVDLLPSAHGALRSMLGPRPPRNATAQLNAARTVLDVAFQLWRASAAAKPAAEGRIGSQPKPGRVLDLEKAAAELQRRMKAKTG